MTEPGRTSYRGPRGISRGRLAGAAALGAAALAIGLAGVRGADPREAPRAAVDAQCAGAVAAAPRSAPLPASRRGATGRVVAPGERPARIAALVARFLAGGPDVALDAEHLPARIDTALDPSRPLRERLAAIRWLARLGDDEAIDVLERLLARDDEPDVRAAIARALGACDHERTVEILTALVDDADPAVVLAAIDGLVAHPGPAPTALLAGLVADPSRPEDVRARAARALGERGDAEALAATGIASPDGGPSPLGLAELAARPIDDAEARVRAWIADPDVDVDAKVAAVEALSDRGSDAAGFLLEVAASADDADLRSAAVDALTMLDEPGDAVGALGALVPTEPDAGVRADLYNTLAFHAEAANGAANGDALVASVLAERAQLPQVEGYRMVASMLRNQFRQDLADTFDVEMVPRLRATAEEATSPYVRHLAVDGLHLAGTDAAIDALRELARVPDPQVSSIAEVRLVMARAQLERTARVARGTP